MQHTLFFYGLLSGFVLLADMNLTQAQTIRPSLQIDSSMPAQWRTRLSHALQQNGVQLDTASATRLFAQLESGRSATLEGMQGREVHGFLLYLTVKYAGEDQVVSTGMIELSGTGASAAAAERNALHQLRPPHRGWQKWVEQFTDDYAAFFGTRCDEIIARAADYAQQDQHLIALALVDGIPADATCASQRSALRERYYLTYQTNHCKDHLNQAQLALTQSKAKAAIDQLAMIDPNSPCATEAQALLARASTQLKEQERAKAAFLRQVYQNQIKIENARNQIISDLIHEEE